MRSRLCGGADASIVGFLGALLPRNCLVGDINRFHPLLTAAAARSFVGIEKIRDRDPVEHGARVVQQRARHRAADDDGAALFLDRAPGVGGEC
jgi:hypothetical protein